VPPAARPSCKDIARQLLEDEPGHNINVRNNIPELARVAETPCENIVRPGPVMVSSSLSCFI